MSHEATAWAVKRKTGSQGAKLVLMCMANYASRTGILWPAQSSLAAQCEFSIDTLQRRMDELESGGFVTKIERPSQNGKKGGRYVYRLMMLADTPSIEYPEPDEAEAMLAETTPQPAASFSDTTPQLDLDHTANGKKPHRTVAVQTVNIKPSLDKPLKETALARVDDWPEGFFEIFWAKYPPGRKTSKKEVRVKLEKIRKAGVVTWAVLDAGLNRYIAARPEPKFTKAPEVWLNKECWEGEAPVGPGNPNPGGGHKKLTMFEIASGKHKQD